MTSIAFPAPAAKPDIVHSGPAASSPEISTDPHVQVYEDVAQPAPPSGQTFGKLLFSILDHPDWSEVSPQGRKSKMCRARTCSVVYGALMFVGRDRECFPCSWMTIEELARVSHSTMARCLAWLEGAGFLVRSTQLDPRTKRRTTTIWRLTIPPEHSRPRAMSHPQRHQAPAPEKSRLRAMSHPEPSCRCTPSSSQAVSSVPDPLDPSGAAARTPPAPTTPTNCNGTAPEHSEYGTHVADRVSDGGSFAVVNEAAAKRAQRRAAGGYSSARRHQQTAETPPPARSLPRAADTVRLRRALPPATAVRKETAASAPEHDRHPSTPGAQAVVKLQRQRWTTPGLWNTDKQVQAPIFPLPY